MKKTLFTGSLLLALAAGKVQALNSGYPTLPFGDNSGPLENLLTENFILPAEATTNYQDEHFGLKSGNGSLAYRYDRYSYYGQSLDGHTVTPEVFLDLGRGISITANFSYMYINQQYGPSVDIYTPAIMTDVELLHWLKLGN
ncbi:MAG TPA: hypothetical protein VF607_07030, partial [Verrucomicrobiae bacterium]